MAKDKKGKGSGTKDACYHKVKSRYSVWPSAYASGALVKCRKVGAKNWGNKSESFEVQDGVVEGVMPEPIDPKKHKDASKQSKINNMRKSDNPNERKVAEKKLTPAAKVDTPVTRTNKIREFSKNTEPKKKPEGPKLMGEGKYSNSETYVKGTAPVRATYGGKTESFPKETYKKKTKTEELNIDLAVDYFFTEGINEDGLDMIIEETGLEKFVEFVEYLTDIEVLTEARAARKARKGAKSYEQVKAEIDAKEKAKAAKREISVDKTKKATATAKAKQPEKKPVRDAIARGVFRAVDAYKKGMERHNAAMATAKKAGKVAGKAAGEFAKGAGEGVKTAGKVAKVAYKVATKEEVELEEKKKSGDPCWVGYKQVGMKKKGAKMVPNCVPEETEVEEGYKPIDKKKENEMYRRAGNLARKSLSSTGAKKKDAASKSAKIVSAISRQKENERFDKMADIKARDNYTEEVVQSILEKCWAGYEKKGMKTMFGKRYPNCVKKKATRKEEVEVKESDSAFDFVKNELIKKHGAASIVGTPEYKAASAKRKAEAEKNKKKPAPDTRTDAQKMTDATGPRPGSRYRGD